MYELKREYEAFQMVDGPFKGRMFRHGERYDAVPDTELHRFREIRGKPKLVPVQEPKAGKLKDNPGGREPVKGGDR